MASLIAFLLAALPNILIAIISKFASEQFLQDFLETILIYALRKIAPLTTNTLDDDLVALVENRLKERPIKNVE